MRTYTGQELKIISLHKLEKFVRTHALARAACRNWHAQTVLANWQKFEDVRKTFNRIDRYKDYYIFDLANHYRLIAKIDFQSERLYIINILHHDKYDRGTWKHDY